MLTSFCILDSSKADVIVGHLQNTRLLRNSILCGQKMTSGEGTQYEDKVVLRFTAYQLRKFIRRGIFSTRSKLKLKLIIVLVVKWILGTQVAANRRNANNVEFMWSQLKRYLQPHIQALEVG